jgi:S1-C subfamily serine protease
MRRRLYIIFIILSFAASYYGHSVNIDSLHPDSWTSIREDGLTPGVTYQISSGTGFFIQQGYFVTNAHVVHNCLNIAVRGAVEPAKAQLVALDKENDLALLYTSTFSHRIAYLRSNNDLKLNDVLFVIGYPLTHADTGDYVTAGARVMEVNPSSNQIEFTAVVDHGNSGGPLLDSVGNVVGVVQGKKSYYHLAADSSQISDHDQPFQVHGVAIGLSTLKNFLAQNRINYASNATYDMFVDYHPEEKAHDYVVNVHCVYTE